MGRPERAGPPDEKVTINLGPVDLGKVDLLVAEGLYSNRTDLIKTAVRRLLDEQDDVVRDAVVRRQLTVGYISYSRKDLERRRAKKERVAARVVGVLHLGGDVTPDLADAAFEEIVVHGLFQAPAGVKARLAGKVRKGGKT